MKTERTPPALRGGDQLRPSGKPNLDRGLPRGRVRAGVHYGLRDPFRNDAERAQYRLLPHGRRGVSGGLLDEGDRPSRERTVLIEAALAMATRRCVLALRQARAQGTTRDQGATAMRGSPALRASAAPSIARLPAGREEAVWR